MKIREFWDYYKRFIAAAVGVIAVGIAIYFAFLRNQALMAGVEHLKDILMPFIIGGCLAYVLSPVCSFLEDKFTFLLRKVMKDKKKAANTAGTLACFGTLVLLFLLIAVLLSMVVPQLGESFRGLMNSVPAYVNEVYNKVVPMLENWGISTNFTAKDWSVTIREYGDKFFQSFKLQGVAGIATSVTKSIGVVSKVFINLVVSIIVSLYCLSGRKRFVLQGKKLIYATFSREWAERILDRLRFANRAFSGFVSGRILDSLIIGCICFVGCSLLKIAYAPLIAVVVGVTNIIPFFGPFIGAVPCAILVLLESPIQALYFVIFVMILQQFDGNILGPLIIGNAVGVSSFWVLFSILLFGGLWGVVGMILGTPLFAVLYSILRDWVNYRLRRKGLPEAACCYDQSRSTQFTLDEGE